MPKPAPTVAFLTEPEIERLDEFFMREGGPEDTMDAAMLDGYLAAVVSGPRLIMPGEMLRWVWDTERGEAQPEFQSNEEAQDIIGLMGLYTMIAQTISFYRVPVPGASA